MPARSCAARAARRFQPRTRSRRGRSQPPPAKKVCSAWLCSFFFVKNEPLPLNQGVISRTPPSAPVLDAYKRGKGKGGVRGEGERQKAKGDRERPATSKQPTANR